MQLMFEEGMEDGKIKGIGLLKGKCEKFKKNKNFPVPHIGYNVVKHTNSKIWEGSQIYHLFILYIHTE